MDFNPIVHKNIIFDLGGVLLNLDYSLTADAFRSYNPSFRSIDAVYSDSDNKKMFEAYEKGEISSDVFRSELKKILGTNLNHTDIDKAWNAMLLDFPHKRIELLVGLSKQYKLFLLSNTNEIHINAYTNYMQKAYGINNLSHVFTKEYYSYKLGMRKPDKEIFEFVLKENNLKPSETFFIDDSSQHIETALEIGISARLLKKGEQVLDVFNL